MKYKIGNKVKMKKGGCDFGHNTFLSKHNYILTIKEYVNDNYYLMEEDSFFCYLEAHIEELAPVPESEPISRFELMEL